MTPEEMMKKIEAQIKELEPKYQDVPITKLKPGDFEKYIEELAERHKLKAKISGITHSVLQGIKEGRERNEMHKSKFVRYLSKAVTIIEWIGKVIIALNGLKGG
jgi:hypothetical protein